jgi:MoaA/NifB/PqqE/SkfB family radical SAM enzyme
MTTEPRIIFCDDSNLVVKRAYRELVHRGVYRSIRSELINRYLTRRRFHRSFIQSSLRIVDIELTNYCNHKCKFCLTGLNANPRPKGKMDLDTFKSIVRDVTPGTVLLFAGFGEPFLNESLEDFLEHAGALGLAEDIEVLSNFAAISEQRIHRLLDHRFKRLVISLDSMSRETFMEYRGCDDFERVFDNIKILSDEVKKRKRIQQELMVQMVINKKNVAESEVFVKAIRDLQLIPRLKQLNTHNSFADQQKINEFEVPEYSRYRNRGYSRRCEWVWGGMAVLWNGDVSMCCQDAAGREVYANVNDQNTGDLLNTATGRCDFRRKYFDDPGNIELCRCCDVA